MKICGWILIVVVICVALALEGYGNEKKILFREDFGNIENWRPFYFPKKKRTDYSIERQDGRHYLRAQSDASASALIYKERFNVYAYPRVKWRWQVNNVYANADDGTKGGDDYPMRVYVAFEYGAEQQGFFERIRNSIIKKVYGSYPPHSTLNYVWASRDHKERIMNSPFTDKVKIVVLQEGSRNIGKWEDQDVDIVEDYRKAFGKSPPPNAGIAIMNDSDNTGESSLSFLEYIEVYR